MAKLSPSILGCDYLELIPTIEKLERAGAQMLHLDVMDGVFVPNISFGVPLIRSIKKHTNMPLDIHLMIDKPHRYIEKFAEYADWLGFHYEAGSPIAETLKRIKELGCKSCLTIKPATNPEEIYEFLPLCDMVLVMSVEPGYGGQKFMPSALDKIEKLSKEAKRQGISLELEIDGGINVEIAKQAVKAGATTLVVGTSLFRSDDIEKTVKEIINI